MKVFFLTLLLTLPAAAQWRHFGSDQVRPTGWFGAGFSSPLNPIATQLKTGWNLAGGVGVTSKYVGVTVDAMYNEFGLNRSTLIRAGVPRGDQRFWAVTVDPIIHVNPTGPVDFYITGGGGLYSRNTKLRANGSFGGPFDYGDDVLASYTVYKGGVNGGAGFAFRLGYGSNVSIFAEARYHHMFTRGAGSSFVPVTVGVRF